jgi:HD-GYP domain-containing protein (c-di-GMP phosphodiesterase class II)
MLKKVDATELIVGMYIHDLSCDWLTHPFVRNRFQIGSPNEIRKIIDAGIHDVVIDTERGLDVPPVVVVAPVVDEAPAEVAAPAVVVKVALGDELNRATQLRVQAAGMVRNVMREARLGKAVEVELVSPMVEKITESVLRNPGALTGLLRNKGKDDYSTMHSVSVCTLLVAFCQTRGMDADTTYQAGLGGLLHDAGMALIPDMILNKAGPLTPAEMAMVQRHPFSAYEMLSKSHDIGPIALEITLHHHERQDGSGYPDKLVGDKIDDITQMAAIVDVYDAITSDRAYRKGVSAGEALRQINELSKTQFNPALVRDFMRCVGIYPVGTMVLLESGRLAVVVEPHETDLLAPKVNVFFNTKNKVYIKPEMVDLSRRLGFGGGDRIVRHESPGKWNVDPMKFMSVA